MVRDSAISESEIVLDLAEFGYGIRLCFKTIKICGATELLPKRRNRKSMW